MSYNFISEHAQGSEGVITAQFWTSAMYSQGKKNWLWRTPQDKRIAMTYENFKIDPMSGDPMREPLNRDAKQNCVVLTVEVDEISRELIKSYWEVKECHEYAHFICKVEKDCF